VSARDEARRLQLMGWVRNLADGSVELEAQGNAESVGQLLEWCHRGPSGARVTAVETEPRPLEPAETSFVVRY
jgi:acylphosphatase